MTCFMLLVFEQYTARIVLLTGNRTGQRLLQSYGSSVWELAPFWGQGFGGGFAFYWKICVLVLYMEPG